MCLGFAVVVCIFVFINYIDYRFCGFGYVIWVAYLGLLVVWLNLALQFWGLCDNLCGFGWWFAYLCMLC